jgi:hypothetical protein
MKISVKNSDNFIDPVFAELILKNLDAVCLEACRELGKEMGFTIDQANFKIDTVPPVKEIQFDFQLILKRESSKK